MIIKPGASLQGLHISMRKVLIQADAIWKAHGRPEGVTITSGTDSTHGAGSWHYYGLALDLRTRYWDSTEAEGVAGELDAALGRAFDVVRESNHIHIENDSLGRRLERQWEE